VAATNLSPLPKPLTAESLTAWAAAQPEHLASHANTVRGTALAFGGDTPHPTAAAESFAVAQHRIEEEPQW